MSSKTIHYVDYKDYDPTKHDLSKPIGIRFPAEMSFPAFVPSKSLNKDPNQKYSLNLNLTSDDESIKKLTKFMEGIDEYFIKMFESEKTKDLHDFNKIINGTETELKFNKEKQCGICLEDYLDGESIIIFKCEHDMHENCFRKESEISTEKLFWYDPAKKIKRCPFCRANLKN